MCMTTDELKKEALKLLTNEDGRYKAGFQDGWEQAVDYLAHQQNFSKPDVVRCKEFLLVQLRKVTGALETMDLRDINRRTQLDRKKAIQTVIQMIDELPAL